MRKLYFPENFVELEFNRKLTKKEMQRVIEGSQPNHNDSKWVIYLKDSWLYFHRFLTGNCMYKIRITCKDEVCEADKIMINGDPEQYKFDEDNELEYVSNIFNLFLENQIK